MEIIKSDVLILGAGLTGLATASFLAEKNITAHILEARDRIGGRVYTKYDENIAPREMGATWLGKKHVYLVKLLEELDLGIFEQTLGNLAVYEPISTSPHQIVQLPPNTDPSFRIKGGTSALIDALAEKLSPSQISLNQVVASLEEEGDELLVKTQDQHFQAPIVVSTLPPFLLHKSIKIHPALPDSLIEVVEQTHTWMGESIKVSLAFKEAFWRKDQLSGTIFSNVGPITEMYDHANVEDQLFALKGFFNGSYFSLSKEERLEMVLNQLRKYYGEQVDDYVSYDEAVWRKEPFTFREYGRHILPHQNNGHPIFQQAYLDGKLFIAGSETAIGFPGYLEGAVRSARFIAGKLTAKNSEVSL